MKLLTALASGIRGAESGFVDIYVRGTSTRAQVFTDYDGTGAETPTASIALDAFGGVELYVNQAVSCRVTDSDGNLVREFVDMDAATDVEVISPSFTGTNYASAVTGANNPVMLSTVLALWKTSAGALDFNVLVGGASKTLQAALGAVSGLIISAGDPAYGAKGDGATDDRAAIQAAITAANAIGAYVVLPPTATNIYAVGAPGLTANGCAGILAGPNTQIQATGVETLLTIAGGSNGKFRLQGYWTASVTNALTVSCTAPIDIIAEGATLINAGSSAVGATYNTNVVSRFIGIGCTFKGLTDRWMNFAPGFQLCLGCRFIHTNNAAVSGLIAPGIGAFVGCSFDVLAGAVAAYMDSLAATTGNVVMAGNTFPNPTGGSVSRAFNTGAQPTGMVDVGNFIGSALAPTSANVSADATGRIGQSFSLERGEQYVASDAASVTLDQNYGSWRIRRSTNGNQTVNLPTPYYAGQLASLTTIGGTGGTQTYTTIKGRANSGALTGNETCMLRAVAVSTALSWVLVGVTSAWS